MRRSHALVSFLSLVLLLSATVSWSMIATLRLPDLVRKAEIICIAKIVKSSEIAVNADQVSTLKTVLQPTRILKGTWNLREPLVIMSYSGGKAGRTGWIEDQVEFPPAGKHVVLFLEKSEDGSLRTVNSVQGVWPLLDDLKTPLGMGQEISLDDVAKAIQEQK